MSTIDNARCELPAFDAMTPAELKRLKDTIDNWSLVLPKDMTVVHEDELAIFSDKDGVVRMTMPWEDYKDVLQWKEEKAP